MLTALTWLQFKQSLQPAVMLFATLRHAAGVLQYSKACQLCTPAAAANGLPRKAADVPVNFAGNRVVLCCRHSLSSWCCRKLKPPVRLLPHNGLMA